MAIEPMASVSNPISVSGMSVRRHGWQWPASHLWLLDGLVALVVTLLVQQGVWFRKGPDESFADKPLTSAILAVATASLFWRRRAPLAVAGTVAGLLLAQTAATQQFSQSPGTGLCNGVALYSLGAYTTAGRAVIGAVLVGLSIQLKSVVATPRGSDDSPFVALFWWLLVFTVLGVGMLMRSRRRTGDLEKDAVALAEARAAHAREAVAEERRRIARELHDVVSHNVSATILQAEAAEEMLKREPDEAAVAVRSIQALNREALGEMRRMLGILRADVASSSPVPQPRLSDLPALVARARESGMEVELVAKGTARGLSPGIELSAYRIVQEALTNARKYARDGRVTVVVGYCSDRLAVSILDDGRSPGPTADTGNGHGLIGMRERVEFFGGDFEAGPRPGGGFSVTATFPMTAADAS